MEKFLSKEDVLSKINELKLQGYDRIHLPGGTSKDGSFYAGGIISIYNPGNKEVYFLGVPYNSRFHLNGENVHNKKDGEIPEETLGRELQEETGLYISLEELELVYEKTLPDNRPGNIGKFHTKNFYLVKNIPSDYLVPVYEGPNHIDGETTAPLWIPAPLFLEVIFKGHLEAVKKSIQKLMGEREYAYALMNIR